MLLGVERGGIIVSCHILQVFLLINPFPRFKNTHPEDCPTEAELTTTNSFFCQNVNKLKMLRSYVSSPNNLNRTAYLTSKPLTSGECTQCHANPFIMRQK